MKNLKTTILSAIIALCCLTNVNAQETHRGKTRGKVVMTGRPGSIVVLGGGTSMPSSDGKDKAFLSNTTTLNADVFFSLMSKSKTSFGLNFGGAYNFGGSGSLGTTLSPFAVTGQTSSVVSDRGGDPAQAGFRMGAGPQANFYFGKLIVSPMILGEYMSVTQKERGVVQTTVVGNQSYDFNLATLPETKTSGFAVTPKLRLHYMFNDRFGFFVDASYITGPKMETTVSKLIPNGIANTPGNDYDLQALQTGTMVKGETKSTAYSAMGFNFGVVIGLGKNKHDTNKNSVLNARRTASGTPIDSTPIAVKYVLGPESASERTAGDIKKGWDGTVKGLFVGNNANVMVANNGGVEKFVEQINEGGKGKASIEKYADKQYVKITANEEISYYPVENSPQFTIINSGGFVCNTTCSSCGPVVSLGPCICGSPTGPISTGGEHPLPVPCGSPVAHPISTYLTSANHEVITTLLTTDDNGHLTASSVKNIETIIISEIPNVKLEKTDLIKDNDQWYLISQISYGENKSLIIKKANMDSKRTLHIGNMSILMYCGGGNCGSGTQSCYSISPVFATYFNCPCITHNCLPQFGTLNGWQTK